MITQENKETISQRFGKYCHEKGVNNDELFKILNTCICYLELKTIAEFAEDNNVSVQHIYQNLKTHKILGLKLITDNN